MESYTVYMHTTPSGKRYIGITSKLPCQRWGRGTHYKTQVFGRAVEKYGWDNIKHEILFKDLTKEEAKAKEIELIQKYRTTEYEYGYNFTAGGDASSNKGKPATKKQLEGLEKGWKEAEKRKRKVICLETLQVFDSVTEAEQSTNTTNISSCIREKGTYHSSGGFHWSYYDSSKDEDYYKSLLATMINTPHRLSTQVICLETKEVFNSIHEASKAVGLSPASICHCCKGKTKTAKGYHWKYARKEIK